MTIYKSILDTIGNTPLIEFPMEDEQCARILMKAEFLEPSGSLKDRMARSIIEAAEASGELKPGGTIVEATAGNTGIAVAMVAAVKGYKTIFAIPDKFSVEKLNMLRAFGSEVITTPTSVPDDHPDSWTQVAKKIAEETPNAILVNQFFNQANVDAHYRSTGPELWEQTGGEIDAFIAGAGSGGTISGVGRYLKEKAADAGKEVKIILMDPKGSVYYDKYYKTGKSEKIPWKLEGIGNDFIPGCLDFNLIDEVRQIGDRRSFFYARRLASECGLMVGDTSGGGVALAIDVARELGPGKTVVCVLCDSGNRYVSKIYNDEWMKANGFGSLSVDLIGVQVKDVVSYINNEVILAEENMKISEAVSIMSDKGISQLPMYSKGSSVPFSIVHESDVLNGILTGEHSSEDLVSNIAKPLEGVLSLEDDISLVETLLDEEQVAVVVDQSREICGILSRIDLVRFLTREKV